MSNWVVFGGTAVPVDLVHPNVLGCSTLQAYVTAAIQSLGFS